MCPTHLFGANCSRKCNCSNNAKCNATTGGCFCTKGWQGKTCSERVCQQNKYGENCNQTCECNFENTEK